MIPIRTGDLPSKTVVLKCGTRTASSTFDHNTFKILASLLTCVTVYDNGLRQSRIGLSGPGRLRLQCMRKILTLHKA